MMFDDFTKQGIIRNPIQPQFGIALKDSLEPYINILAEALDFSIKPRKKIFG
jgi:hypothetical protein